MERHIYESAKWKENDRPIYLVFHLDVVFYVYTEDVFMYDGLWMKGSKKDIFFIVDWFA